MAAQLDPTGRHLTLMKPFRAKRRRHLRCRPKTTGSKGSNSVDQKPIR